MRERRLLLLRHAKPLGDGVPRFLGQGDPPLSPEGVADARRLRERLGLSPEIPVYCSPLRRCVETARRLSPAPVPVPGLAEIRMGTWEGRPRAEIRALFPEEYEARGRDFARFAPPGGESFAQVARRACAAVEDLLCRTEGDLVVVAHAGVNRTLLCTAAGLPLGELMTFPQHYCGLSTLVIAPGGCRVESVDRLL